MGKSYFYKIKNKATGRYYVGSQYGKTAHKDNFFVTYFTSCQRIKDILLLDGPGAFEVITVTERDDARDYETYYLRKCYRLLGKDKFLETFYNRSIGPGILLDDSITAKQTKTKKYKWARGEIKKPMPPNWEGRERSQKMKQRLSQSKTGHSVSEETRLKISKSNSGKKQTVSTKEKRANSLLLNENAYGKKHWLFISPDKKYYCTIGKRNVRLHDLNLSEGPGFFKYVNTNTSPGRGKNRGWLFYEGKDTIATILQTVKQESIIYYE